MSIIQHGFHVNHLRAVSPVTALGEALTVHLLGSLMYPDLQVCSVYTLPTYAFDALDSLISIPYYTDRHTPRFIKTLIVCLHVILIVTCFDSVEAD